MNGEILESHEILSLRMNESKKFTFQREAQKSIVKRTSISKLSSFSLLQKSEVDALKTDLRRSQKLIDKLIQENKVYF